MKLPTLYKATKTGATQQCIITYANDIFTVQFGQVDGAQQTKDTTCYGTNIGRSNERTPTQQAEFEAKAKWTKKVKSGYTEDPSGVILVSLPMKVKVFQDQRKNVTYPCQSTPKINGVNATYTLTGDNHLILTSRGGEDFPPIPHLEAEVRDAMTQIGTDVLNGELYIHGYHLQDITSAVKKPKVLSTKLEFDVFDIPSEGDLPYSERRDEMDAVDIENFRFVSFLTGVICDDENDLEAHYNQCMKLKLEGTVIKNLDGLYKYNIRSSEQFKYKKVLDGEFKVIGHKLDKNNHPVFVCVVPSGATFNVKLKGTNEERTAMGQNATSYYEKWLKIEFETYSKDLIPLKPVGIMFRTCDLLGNPIV